MNTSGLSAPQNLRAWDGITLRLYQIKANAGTNWDMTIVSTTGSGPPMRAYKCGRMKYLRELKAIAVMPAGNRTLCAMRIA